MTFEEVERALKEMKDNLVVQAELGRHQDERIHALITIAEGHERRLVADREDLREMQAAMAALFQRMDAFIRGLESDGHKGKGEA